MPRPGKKDILERSRSIRTRSRLRKIIILAFLLLIILGIFIFLFRLEYFQINDVRVFGNIDIETKDVKGEVLEEIGGKYFYVIPKNRYLFISKEKIEEALRQKFPNAFSIKVTKNFPNGLDVSIVERNIKAVYCSSKREKCAFVDSRGYVFAPSPIYSDGVYLIITASASNSPEIMGEFIGFDLPEKENFPKILAFQEETQKFGKELYMIDIGQNGIYRFYFSEGWNVLMKKNDNFLENAKNLRILLKQKVKERSLYLDYVDLRLGNKVFYKFR